MKGRNLPVTSKSALHKLEVNPDGVRIHASVAQQFKRRGWIEPVDKVRYRLTEKGHAFVKALNDPTLTLGDILGMYA